MNKLGMCFRASNFPCNLKITTNIIFDCFFNNVLVYELFQYAVFILITSSLCCFIVYNSCLFFTVCFLVRDNRFERNKNKLMCHTRYKHFMKAQMQQIPVQYLSTCMIATDRIIY